MIRINLLPVREAKRQASVRRQGVLLGIGGAVGVAISISLNLMVAAQAKSKQAEITRATQDLEKLKETRAEVEKYRAEKEEIERKLLVIARLEKNRSGQVRILDELATRIPERMWLEKLSFKGAELTVRGVSIDAEIVAEFLTKLDESPMIEDVVLDGTTVKETDGLMLNTFSVRSRIEGAGVEPPAAPAGKRK